MTHRSVTGLGQVALVALLMGCGGGADAPAPPALPAAGGGGGDLTAFQLEHGIGPVTEPVVLPEAVDHAMAEAGEEVFEQKCSACHKLGEKYIGPALGEVLDRRTPTFVLNMILNPQEMIERHPVVQELLAQTMSFMPNQGLTREEARAVIEYIRSEHH